MKRGRLDGKFLSKRILFQALVSGSSSSGFIELARSSRKRRPTEDLIRNKNASRESSCKRIRDLIPFSMTVPER